MKRLLLLAALLYSFGGCWERCDPVLRKEIYFDCVRPFKKVTGEVERGCSERAKRLSSCF